MLKACIFDLDGTLCDSVESLVYTGNLTLREMGLKEATTAQYKVFVGDGVDMLTRRLLNNAGDTEAVQFDEFKRRYLENFKEGCLYHLKAYPGIAEALAKLKEKGALLGVLSNKPDANTKSVISQTFGEGLFDWVQGQCDAFPRKPDPSAALSIAARFGVKPEECLYAGDTSTDMKTGTAAGMYTVGVLWGFRGRDELLAEGADALAEKAADLAELYGAMA